MITDYNEFINKLSESNDFKTINNSFEKQILNYYNGRISLENFNNKIDKFFDSNIEKTINESLKNDFTLEEVEYLRENSEQYSNFLNENVVDKMKSGLNKVGDIGKKIIKSKVEYIKDLYKDSKKAVEMGKDFIKNPQKLADKLTELGEKIIYSITSGAISMFKSLFNLFSKDKDIRKENGDKLLEAGKSIFIKVSGVVSKLLQHYKKHKLLYNIIIGVLVGGAAGIIITGTLRYGLILGTAVAGGVAASNATKKSGKEGKEAFKHFLKEFKPALKTLGITIALMSICGSVSAAYSSGNDIEDAFNNSYRNNTKIDIKNAQSLPQQDAVAIETLDDSGDIFRKDIGVLSTTIGVSIKDVTDKIEDTEIVKKEITSSFKLSKSILEDDIQTDETETDEETQVVQNTPVNLNSEEIRTSILNMLKNNTKLLDSDSVESLNKIGETNNSIYIYGNEELYHKGLEINGLRVEFTNATLKIEDGEIVSSPIFFMNVYDGDTEIIFSFSKMVGSEKVYTFSKEAVDGFIKMPCTKFEEEGFGIATWLDVSEKSTTMVWVKEYDQKYTEELLKKLGGDDVTETPPQTGNEIPIAKDSDDNVAETQTQTQTQTKNEMPTKDISDEVKKN